jgi:serine/threonine-protein kinase RsbW
MPESNSLTFIIPSEKKCLEKVEEFVSLVWCSAVGPETRDINRQLEEYKLKLAVHEACLNIIRHAYKDDPSKEILIECRISPQKIEFHIFDNGLSFNYDLVQKDFGNEPMESGYGIPLIFALMDEVTYEAGTAKGNVFNMAKSIEHVKS